MRARPLSSTPEPTIAPPGDGLCSLRKAINNANAKSDKTSGDCNPGTGNDMIAIFVLSGQISVDSALPAIQNTLTIVGPGQGVPINGGAKGFTIFGINSTATVSMNDLAIENGNEFGWSGQGMVNFGTLNVTNCTIQFTSVAGNGSGIANGGTLNVSDSTFYNNFAFGSGGAIANDSGVGSVINSTFADNSAGLNGGAIYNGQNKRFVVTNSTFSGNAAAQIDSNGMGASLYNELGGALIVVGTIVTGAGAPSSECNYPATISDIGYNISDDFSCQLMNSDATPGANGQTLGDDVDPQLDPSGLQDNGGPTDTIALQAGSPAIEAIPISSGLCPSSDQRGFSRPNPGDCHCAVPCRCMAPCDVGAFESDLTPTPTPTATPRPTTKPTHEPTTKPTPARTPTRTATRTKTHTATPSPSATRTRMPTPTPTRTTTRSPAPTHTPTRTPSHAPTRTPSHTPARTPSHTPARTPSHTPARTPSHTPTRTPSHIPTATSTPRK